MTMHIYAAITHHGYGHLAQIGPVLNTLRVRAPKLRLTIRSAVPAKVIRRHIVGEYVLIPEPVDVGMLMDGALTVRGEASALAYAEFHRDWPQRVAEETAHLKALAPDCVVANAPYLPLAAAQAAGIPAIALCSLNWAALYAACCRAWMDAQIHAQMLAAYRSAALFLQPVPSMPMPELPNARPIGPIARLGADRRAELRAALGLHDNTRLVLVSLGGIPTAMRLDLWPRQTDIHWLVPTAQAIPRPDMISLETAGIDFIDALRSADALVTKPGYGSFAEAACNGIPVLYVRRGDWPEEEYLIAWLTQQARALEIGRAQLASGAIVSQLTQLWSQAPRPRVSPTGAMEAADLIAALLPAREGLMIR